MQGAEEVIAGLNELLTEELTSADLYRYWAAALDDQGFGMLRDRLAHEAEDEQGHAKLITDRILFLEGTPDVLSRNRLEAPRGPEAILKASLAYEYEVGAMLNRLIALCREHGDNGSRTMLEGLLVDTESDHMVWLEAQLELIEQVGRQNYLAQQLG